MIEPMLYPTFRARLPIFLYILLFLATLFPCAWGISPAVKVAATSSTQPSSTPTVGDYACILNDDAFFYASADERKGLFLLPQSYYVRLIEYRSDFCKVEYQRNESDAQRLVGYAKTQDLTFVEYAPVRPYLYYVFDVTYTIENAELNSSFLTQITLSCVYYGDYLVGSETYCYVLRGEEFGYIPKPNGLFYEENTEYADYLASLAPPPSEEPPKDTDENKTSPMQIAILIVICLLVPILAAFIVKPPHKTIYQAED